MAQLCMLVQALASTSQGFIQDFEVGEGGGNRMVAG